MTMKLVEPYVKVDERIRDYPTRLDVDGSLNLGVVIAAPAGPRIAYITSPTQFLQTFTVDGTVPRNAHITFLNAYYMSFFAGLVVVRSMNTTAVNGAYAYESTNSGTRYKYAIEIEDSSDWGFAYGGNYYYHSNMTPEQFMAEFNIGENEESSRYAKLIDPLTGDPVYPVEKWHLVGTLDEAIRLATGDTGFFDPTSGCIITPDNDLQIEQYVNIGWNPDATELNNVACEFEAMMYKDKLPLQYELTIDLVNSSTLSRFQFGNVMYYKGAIDKTKYADFNLVKFISISEIESSINRMTGMSAIWDEGDTLTVCCSDGNQIDRSTIKLTYTVEESGATVEYADQVIDVDWVDNLEGINVLFHIIPSTPAESDIYSVNITPVSGSLFNLSFKGVTGETKIFYEQSLVMDATDSSGVNAYIDNLNATTDEFDIVVNEDYISTKQVELAQGISAASAVFGDSGLSYSASTNPIQFIDALNVLRTTEEYTINALATAGMTDIQFIKNYTLLGKDKDWFAPVDIPYNRTNINSINSYFLNVLDHSQVMAMGPFDKNTGLVGWRFYNAASSLYWERVYANKAVYKEFAGVYELSSGVLNYTNPVYTFNQSQREELLNLKCPINFAKFDKRNDVWYFNDNRTHQSVETIVTEDQNRRTINKIKQDVYRIMQSFKGGDKQNNDKLRADIRSILNYYINSEWKPQHIKPVKWNIICDESNNSIEWIARNPNKLALTVQVQLANTVKFIDVLVDVFPLGVDFEG